MRLRPFADSDAPVLLRLFNETVHTINAADYTADQLDAWAPEGRNLADWSRSFQGHDTLVAIVDDAIVALEICRHLDI